MPKMKSHRGAAKRFKQTASGKIKRNRPFGAHFQTKKTTKRRRQLRKAGVVTKPDERRVKRLLGSG